MVLSRLSVSSSEPLLMARILLPFIPRQSSRAVLVYSSHSPTKGITIQFSLSPISQPPVSTSRGILDCPSRLDRGAPSPSIGRRT